jgi:hypothetical protein
VADGPLIYAKLKPGGRRAESSAGPGHQLTHRFADLGGGHLELGFHKALKGLNAGQYTLYLEGLALYLDPPIEELDVNRGLLQVSGPIDQRARIRLARLSCYVAGKGKRRSSGQSPGELLARNWPSLMGRRTEAEAN